MSASSSEQVLAVDEDDAYSTSSDYMSDGGDSYATTLESTVYNFRYENGRRYHGYREGTYLMPNDEKQNDQLDVLHHVFTVLLGGELYAAPINPNPERILDLGTGTGIWAIDIADIFPNAEVIGNDLSPTQPHWVPPNLQFEVDDFNSEWTHRPNSYDFIHARNLTCCVKDGATLIREAFAALKPGGWYESVDVRASFESDDGTIVPGSALHRWHSLYVEAEPKLGMHVELVDHMEGWMRDAGFINQSCVMKKVPIGEWPRDKNLKELGRLNQAQLLEGIEGFFLAFATRLLGWEAIEAQLFLGKVRNELKDKKIHSYFRVHRRWAQKPEIPAGRRS